MVLVNRVPTHKFVKGMTPQAVRFHSDQKFLSDHGLTEEDVRGQDCGEINGEWVSQFVVLGHAMHKVKSPPAREVQPPEPKGRKDDAEKPRYDLIPFAALAQVVGVLTYGARKYAPENWRKVEGWRWRYLGAALRHVTKWAAGERIDPESGHPHLAHALCCLMFLAELDT